MSTRWSEGATLRLIRLYKTHELLWNRKDNRYKDMLKRKDAYKEIVKEMGIPHLTLQDVKSKIKNLRTAYYLESRKMMTDKWKHRMLRPMKWFHEFKDVMEDIQTDVRLTPSKPLESNSESDEYEADEERSTQLNSLFDDENNSNADVYVVSIKQEFLDEMENCSNQNTPSAICDYLEPVRTKRPVVTLNTHLEKQETEREPVAKKSKHIDEFQVFANNIAHQLRNMPLDKALKLQLQVQSMIAKERIHLYMKQVERADDEEDFS